MNIIKTEKTISVKGTAKRKAHKRKITFEGKVKDPVQFIQLHPTGIDDLDQKISFAMHDFEKKVAEGLDMRTALKEMVNAKSKLYYTKSGIDEPKVDIVMRNLAAICGDSLKGLVSDLNIHVQESGRSNYVSDTIYVSRDKNLSGNIYHEFSHALEYSKKSIHRAAVKFLDRRTEGEDAVLLDDLIPGIGYGDETTKKNHFIHPYIGRQYPYQASTEILSMGLQNFTTDKQMESFYNADREHFALCLAAITSRI